MDYITDNSVVVETEANMDSSAVRHTTEERYISDKDCSRSGNHSGQDIKLRVREDISKIRCLP